MLEQKDILRRVRAFLSREAPRIARLNGYYLGRQDILRPPRDPVKPDNRLVNAFCRNITDCTVGYFMGRGVRYDVSDPRTAAWLAAVADASDERFVNNALARDLSVCGRAAELLWYDAARGLPRFTPLPAGSVFPVWDGSVDPALLAAIRVYRPEDADGYTVEVYDENAVTEFAFDGASLTERARREHFFGEVPMTEYWNDADERGDFEGVLTLIDAYDALESDRVNDKEQFVDALLLLSGCTLESDERGRTPGQQLREDKVLVLPDADARAEWLCKQLSETDAEVLKRALETDIHKLSMVPDLSDEHFAGVTSGVAMRYKLLGLEQLTRVKERWFREALRCRLRLFSEFLAVRGAPRLEAGKVRMTFTRTLPVNELEQAQAIGALKGVLDDEALARRAERISGEF